mgnify:CR=1 FL=1
MARTLTELMRELQGAESQEAFARRIGVAQTLISKIYRGERDPGIKVARGLAKAFPERIDDIQALFFGHE